MKLLSPCLTIWLLIGTGGCSGPKPLAAGSSLSAGSSTVSHQAKRPHDAIVFANAHPQAIRPECGDGRTELPEECDDGNQVGGDGCSARCREEAVHISANGYHVCVLLRGGGVKCWGRNDWGQLGYGDTNNRGDEPGEMGEALKYVDLGGGRVVKVASGKAVTCSVLEDGSAKCWGGNASGSTLKSMGVQLQSVQFDRRVVAFDALNDLCAFLEDGSLHCITKEACSDWGFARVNCGLRFDEYRLKWTPVLIKDTRRIVQITSGVPDCALFEDGSVKCWGAGWPSVGHSLTTMMSGVFKKRVPDVPLRTDKKVTYIASYFEQVCVILDTGEVGCWGKADSAASLGYYSPEKNEAPPPSRSPEDPPEVQQFWHTGLPKKLMRFTAKPKQVAPAANGGCALLENNQVKCWGDKPQLATEDDSAPRATEIDGQVTTPPLYTLKMPANCAPKQVAISDVFCVLCDGGCVKCWGDNSYGQLGYGDKRTRQDPPVECVDY